jgi:dihydroorotate dehydrogenase electron transfer subunit
MVQEYAPISTVKKIASDIFELSFLSSSISRSALPGQFVNIRAEDSAVPLLRRPFSIFSIDGDLVSIIFNVVGLGTKLLAQKKAGDTLDVLGPLGKGVFPFEDKKFETAVLVAGGLGVAAFPFLTSRLGNSKKIVTFLGARTSSYIVRQGLDNVHVATDDGSEGFQGTVVDLLKKFMAENSIAHPRVYTCGPTPMMRGLAKYCVEKNISCYAALECEMACGIGLCQGCPVETRGAAKKYKLVCNDGPVFEVHDIIF